LTLTDSGDSMAAEAQRRFSFLCLFLLFVRETHNGSCAKGADNMSNGASDYRTNELNPKQPEFVLTTSTYEKCVFTNQNFAHFYQFVAESDQMSVIPDACIDILFWFKDGRARSKIAGSRLYKGYTSMEMGCEYFGVRFMPGINPVNRQIKQSELVNSEYCFDELISSSSERERLLENLCMTESFSDRIRIFTDFFAAYSASDQKGALQCYLMNAILHADGSQKLDSFAEQTGYSNRYLNQKVNEFFGINPNHLLRIIRFQNAITQLTKSITDVRCIDIANESGYYDQSHFYKDFKHFTGLTPTVYMNNLINNAYGKKLHVVK